VAAYALKLCARWQRSRKGAPWTRPPDHPERLGNLLQRLITKEPELVFVIENIVAEMLDQLEP